MPSASDIVEKLGFAAAGAAVGALLVHALQRRDAAPTAAPPTPDADASPADAELSTTSSGHSGDVYETKKAVAEYLQFHFGRAEDVLPFDGPRDALDFAARTARITRDKCREYGVPLDRALDVGCSVGRSSFEMARWFENVVGVDFSHAFVDAAKSMQRTKKATYSYLEEGEVMKEGVAEVDASIDVSRVQFEQGDACALRADLGKFDVVHGANLLCRLPDPVKFLKRLRVMLEPGGLAIFISPYSWLPQYTAKEHWLGGFSRPKAGGAPGAGEAVEMEDVSSFDGLKKVMESHFELLEEEDVPFLIREHRRKYQWGCSHLTVWRRRHD